MDRRTGSSDCRIAAPVNRFPGSPVPQYKNILVKIRTNELKWTYPGFEGEDIAGAIADVGEAACAARG
jgi:hypothetical protein